MWRRLPPRDHPITFDADQVPRNDLPAADGPTNWTDGLVEKIVLLGLISVIFAEVIPNSSSGVVDVLVSVAVVVAGNAAVHAVVRGRHGQWASVGAAFGGSLLINAGIFALASVLLPSDDEGSSLLAVGFFLFLISLIVALFDRYRPRRPAFTLTDPPAPSPAPATTD